MTTITDKSTAHASQVEITADFSAHLNSMRLAQATDQGNSTGYLIAKASVEEKEIKAQDKEDKLSTMEKFERGIYNNLEEEAKAPALMNCFNEETNRVTKALKTVGYKGLEIEYFPTRGNVRAYNMSLFKK